MTRFSPYSVGGSMGGKGGGEAMQAGVRTLGGGGVMPGGVNINKPSSMSGSMMPQQLGGRPMGVGGAMLGGQNVNKPSSVSGPMMQQAGGRPMGVGGVMPGMQNVKPGAAAGANQSTAASAAPNQPNVFTQAAGAYNTALQGPNLQQFQNPFQQQVIDRTAADINAAQQAAMNQLGQQASAAGAFGGSRHGIAEAQTNAGFVKQLADTSANLNMQGFNTALDAAQNQQQMMSQLAGQGFGFGQALNLQQMQQGQMQQAAQQALIDAARGQYAGFTGAPQNALSLPMAAVGAANMGQSTTTGTQSYNPGLFDYLSLGASMMCWVAREVYGEEDPRWLEFRHWLTNFAPKWLLKAYAKHGEWFAGVVRKVPVLKRALRPLMDKARRSIGFAG